MRSRRDARAAEQVEELADVEQVRLVVLRRRPAPVDHEDVQALGRLRRLRAAPGRPRLTADEARRARGGALSQVGPPAGDGAEASLDLLPQMRGVVPHLRTRAAGRARHAPRPALLLAEQHALVGARRRRPWRRRAVARSFSACARCEASRGARRCSAAGSRCPGARARACSDGGRPRSRTPLPPRPRLRPRSAQSSTRSPRVRRGIRRVAPRRVSARPTSPRGPRAAVRRVLEVHAARWIRPAIDLLGCAGACEHDQAQRQSTYDRPHPRPPPRGARSARPPQCAGGGVLEQDSALAQAFADGVRCTEILALARLLRAPRWRPRSRRP